MAPSRRASGGGGAKIPAPAVSTPPASAPARRSPANGRRASPGGSGAGARSGRKSEPPAISPGTYSHAVQQMNRRQRKSTVQRLSSSSSDGAASPVSPPRVAEKAAKAESPALAGGMAYNLAQIERRQREAAIARGEDPASTDGVCTPPSPPPSRSSRRSTDAELGAMLMKGGAEPPARKLRMQSSASVALNSRQSFEMRLKDRKKAEQRRAEIHALNRVLARRDAQQFGECLVVVGGSNVYGQAQTVWQYHPQVGVWRKLCQLLEPRCNAASCGTPRGDLISCGGYITGGTFVDTVEIFESRLKASRVLPSMPHGVYGGRACCVGDNLFVVGGQSCEEVRRYSDAWLAIGIASLARRPPRAGWFRSLCLLSDRFVSVCGLCCL
jgi:hypothetical protein